MGQRHLGMGDGPHEPGAQRPASPRRDPRNDLPHVDRFLFLFEQWLPVWLEEVPDREHRKILQRYATWHTLRRLRAVATTKPIGHYRHQLARKQLRVAAAFLGALTEHGIALSECTQADLDAGSRTPRHLTRQRCVVPALGDQVEKHVQADTPFDHRQRRAHTDRIAAADPTGVQAGDGMDLTERVIALLVLLYAQPLPKITRLTVDDITVDDGQMLIRLGDPPAPVPPPFDAIISQYLAARPNLTTATNPGSRWLFPGRRAGQPPHPTTMRLRFNNLGITDLSGRSRAPCVMLLHAPPSVVAGILGYTPNRAEAVAAEAGATWKHYARATIPAHADPTSAADDGRIDRESSLLARRATRAPGPR